MKDVLDARRAELVVEYNGKDITRSLADSLVDFTYNDAAPGSLDDLQLSLEDRLQNWQGPWSPSAGDTIKAEIRTFGWNYPEEEQKLPCGTFEVDSFDFGGPPDTVSIKAVSLPVDSGIRQEKRTKAWENVTLRTLAGDVARAAGLTLFYSADVDPSYERLEQTDQSDLGFLNEQAMKEGIAVKISEGQLVLFDEAEYEKKDPALTLVRGEDAIASHKFGWSTAYTAYRACEVTYSDSAKNKTYQAMYVPPGAPAEGPVLKINEQVDSEAAAMRLAAKSLREKNKEAGKASLSLSGDVRMASGVTLLLQGWNRFDGKYLIESASHKVGSGGYTTDIEIRKVLGW
ncbi:phage late control D family protein [Paenibacillus chitinolyticus]